MQRSTYRVDGIHVAQARPDAPHPARPPLLPAQGTAHGAWCRQNRPAALAGAGWEVNAPLLRNHSPPDIARALYFHDMMPARGQRAAVHTVRARLTRRVVAGAA